MNTSFEAAMRDSLTERDIDLPHEIWTLIAWLEERGQRFETPAGSPFLAIGDVTNQSELWSQVFFDVPPDLVRFWFGRDGLEKQVIPFVHCGGDGSYIALWRHPGDVDRFVFLGSEGEAFTVAATADALIAILTMGYPFIESRHDLVLAPEQLWEDLHSDPWPEPVKVKDWVRGQFGTQYPFSAASLLPFPQTEDPFAAFVHDMVEH